MRRWFWLAVLPNGKLRWPGWYRPLSFILLLGFLIAGLIYAYLVVNALRERGQGNHVHAHSTH